MRSWRILFILAPAALLAALAWLINDRTSPAIPATNAQEDPATTSTIVTAAASRDLQESKQLLDPVASGWPSEALADRMTAQLAALFENRDAEALSAFATQQVQLSALRPRSLEESFRDDIITVRKSTAPSDVSETGLNALHQALHTLTQSLAEVGDAHLKPKIIAIEVADPTTITTVIVEGHARGDSGSRQFRARWNCGWTLADPESPRLSTITCESYQEAHAVGRSWFQDATPSIIGHTEAAQQQLSIGLHDWLTRIERTHGMLYFQRHGLAVADVNGDDRDDLYVCQGGGLPNRLFIQNPDGTADDVSKQAGVDWLDNTASALFVDLDNDGDQDLVLATFEGLLVLEQHEPLRFVRRKHLPTKDTDVQSLSAVDYDGDGKLDLYLCVDFADSFARTGEPAPDFVYHDANEGGENKLWRNAISVSGAWNFTDVTAMIGLDQHNRRHSLAAAWEDYDNDGDQDLYVANDYGQNCLYHNHNGHFEDIATSLGLVDYGSGMSVSWADFNRDGLMDLYVGNMFSSAGSRLATQANFLENSRAEVKSLYQRFTKGNSLFVNDNLGFHDLGHAANVDMGRWAWSSPFADINNDGYDDLLVANGYITTEDSGDL